uniref:Mitogen-activated protein kinase kinase kinase n=1 Tax=Caenorhabditis japonica TaxID=281687 RepID=A0A8R1DPM4_CAEJA
MNDHHEFPPYVNVPPIAKTRSTSHLAPTPEHHRSVSYEDTTTTSTSTDSAPAGVRIRSEGSQVSCDSPTPAPRKYVAAYEYKAQKDDELDLPLGSIVKLVTAETHEDGWFRGELEGKIGLFPSNYARLLPETETLVEFSADEIRLPDENSTLDNHNIGRGATATVYKVEIRTHKEIQGGRMGDGCFRAALKQFHRHSYKGSVSQLEQLKREANLVNGLSHNNIVRLLGICLDDPYFGLLLELCEGYSLRSVCHDLNKDIAIPLGVLIDWARQVSEGMAYLTKEGYVHRDLKADNVLVKEEVCFCVDEETMKFEWCSRCGRRPLDKLQLKITDFGVSRKMSADANRFSSAGTHAWLAPEAFRDEIWSEASDVWSYGVVLWEMLSREDPYQGLIPVVIAFQVARSGQSLVINKNCPEKWKDIMQHCWALEPSQRPRFQEIVRYFTDYAKELEKEYVHVQRAPSIMAVKEIYTECFVDQRKELEKMFHDLYTDTGDINRKSRRSIAPETKARKNKINKGKKLEITGPIGEVKHILSVHLDKANNKSPFTIKYGDDTSTGGTLPRLNGRQNTLSISSPDLFQLPDINTINGSSTVSHNGSASRILRQKAIRKKKNHHNAYDSPVVSPTGDDDSTSFAKIENADDVDPSASKETKNGTLSRVWNKIHPWRHHKRDSKDEEVAGSISSRSSSTTSSHRIIAGQASRSAAAPPFLDVGGRSRALSAADCWDESSISKRNKVSPSDNKRPVKQTNLTERFVKDPDVVRPSNLPTFHRKSALDQTIPASPSSPDSNYAPMQLNSSSRRTTATSSTDGTPNYEMLVTNSATTGVGHGQRNYVIQPVSEWILFRNRFRAFKKLSDNVPFPADQPTHYLLRNGLIYDAQGTGHGHARATYYPVGGGCDDYVAVGTVKPTVGEVNNSPYSDMSGHFSGRNVLNPQYVHCKPTPKLPLKEPTLPIKIQSDSNLVSSDIYQSTSSRPEKLKGIGNSASSYSLNDPPQFPAPLPPDSETVPPMSPPKLLAPVLPLRDSSLSPILPRGRMDQEILKTPDVHQSIANQVYY